MAMSDEADDPGCMKFVPTSEPIDLIDFGDCMGTEELRELLNEYPPRLDFPITFDFGNKPSDGRSGPPVFDPATLYLELPFAEGYPDGRVNFSCSLEDVIDDFIEGNINHVTKKITSASSKVLCAKLSTRLRELANKLDNVCGERNDEQHDA